MTRAPEGKERYVAAFSRLEGELRGAGPGWIHRLRRRAIERFADRGFPTTKEEPWRHTNLAPLEKAAFEPALGRDGVPAERLARLAIGPREAARLVFVNGRFARDLSTVGTLPARTVVGSLADALARDPERLEPLLSGDGTGPHEAFHALNTAFFRDGAFVHLPEGGVVEDPIHLLFVSTEPGRASHPRNLVLAERGSRAVLLERYVGLAQGPTFTNAVTDVLAGEATALDWEKLQEESEQAFHVASLRLRARRDATLASRVVTLGGGLVRDEVEAFLDDEGIDLTLDGLYLVDGARHVDHQTRIVHAKPRCTSRELYKGILDGASRGVFEGTIVVRPDAQKTVARQTNKNLLLSREALATTRPVLEIHADDVKCNHGATIGQLDDDALFYLRSRGVGVDEARRLLLYGFARELLDRLKVATVRDIAESAVLRRFAEARP